MNPNIAQAHEHIVNAREAMKRGDKDTARDLAEKAVLLQNDLMDAWLILVATDANPEDALAYAQKALELDPQSPRAQKAVQWAMNQLQNARRAQIPSVENARVREASRDERSEAPVVRPQKRAAKKSPASAPAKSGSRTLLYAGVVLGLLLCVVIVFAAWSAFNNPAFASSFISAATPTQEPLWAQVNIAKPGATPIDVSAFAQAPTSVVIPSATYTLPPTATNLPTLAPTDTAIPTETLTATPEPTETPAVLAMEVLADTPTSEYVAPTNAPVVIAGAQGERWIDVNLSAQTLTAYVGDTPVNSFVVSTGTWLTPTVTGKYKIWIKFRFANMSGPGYFLPDVPYVMYFYKGYGIHGTYWHNNFGTPMSHGCVNMRISDAEWVYNWSSVGTVVSVHY
jgi:lipoprotein-anchoring transpeptidase ErfK/SrfK